MTDVIRLVPKAAPEVTADEALERAKGMFGDVLVLGWDHDGDLSFTASSRFGNAAQTIFLVEMFKAALLSGEFSDDD